MKKYFAAAALLVTMAACGSAAQDKTLEGTTWKLAKMESIPATAINQETDFFTLEFNAADTMVAGRTNCNRFFGKYELKGKELSFENLGMTRMACPDMQYEDAFVKMLDEVDSYEISRWRGSGARGIFSKKSGSCAVRSRNWRIGFFHYLCRQIQTVREG